MRKPNNPRDARFFQGAACKRGHDGLRYVADRKCVKCGAESRAKAWAENREAEQRRWREWHSKNKPRHDLNFRNWRAEHADYDRARCTTWQQANPGQSRANNARYFMARKNACPSWVDRKALQAIYKKCGEMNAGHPTAFHVDHIVPILGKNVCGLHVPWNLQILTAHENKSKNNRFVDE